MKIGCCNDFTRCNGINAGRALDCTIKGDILPWLRSIINQILHWWLAKKSYDIMSSISILAQWKMPVSIITKKGDQHVVTQSKKIGARSLLLHMGVKNSAIYYKVYKQNEHRDYGRWKWIIAAKAQQMSNGASLSRATPGLGGHHLICLCSCHYWRPCLAPQLRRPERRRCYAKHQSELSNPHMCAMHFFDEYFTTTSTINEFSAAEGENEQINTKTRRKQLSFDKNPRVSRSTLKLSKLL